MIHNYLISMDYFQNTQFRWDGEVEEDEDNVLEEPVAVENIFLQMEGALYMKYTIFARRDKLERFARNGFINFLIYSQN
jgi:hypothetical protein